MPRAKEEDLITSVLDPKVIEAISKALIPVITATIEKCIEDKLSQISFYETSVIGFTQFWKFATQMCSAQVCSSKRKDQIK